MELSRAASARAYRAALGGARDAGCAQPDAQPGAVAGGAPKTKGDPDVEGLLAPKAKEGAAGGDAPPGALALAEGLRSGVNVGGVRTTVRVSFAVCSATASSREGCPPGGASWCAPWTRDRAAEVGAAAQLDERREGEGVLGAADLIGELVLRPRVQRAHRRFAHHSLQALIHRRARALLQHLQRDRSRTHLVEIVPLGDGRRPTAA
eukprot:6983908-Prymnesium_polylepis.1